MKRVVVIFALVALTFGIWWATYPDKYDHKNPHYVLWKHHLAAMDLDRASSVIINDPDRDSMILGKTKPELVQRFGYLRTPAQVRPYLRDYCWAARPNSDAMFLRDRDLMIVFVNGRASEIITCKG